jgi:acyl-CoA reductase-like NAD-dependent aldehyde dehydrogenase
MLGIISFIIGLFMVLASVYLIRREVLRATREERRAFNSLSDENVAEVMAYLKKIEKELDDLNASYYEIVSDLEGKYSVHDKEIEILQEKIEALGQIKRSYKEAKADIPIQLAPIDEQERICQEAVKLKHEGLSIRQIARELNLGIGELQLILKTKR